MTNPLSAHEPATPPPAPVPAEDAGRPAVASRSRVGRDCLVAVIALAIGVAGSAFTLRYMTGAPRAAVTTDAAGTGEPAAGTAGGAMAGMNMAGSDQREGGPGSVYVSPARQQLIGVRTAAVTSRALDASIRTVGTLAYDETRVTEIHPKVSGWVERVFVDFVGKAVRRGQPLLTLYSPDLVATQNEYLLALRAQRQLRESAFAETRASADSLVAATRERLRLWDVTDTQVAELERTGQAQRTLTLYSPFDGIARVMQHASQPPEAKDIPSGCLMANTALELGLSDADVAAEVKKLFRSTEKTLTAAVKDGQERGQITTQFDAAAIAQSLANTINGIRILQNTGASDRHVKTVVELSLAAIRV